MANGDEEGPGHELNLEEFEALAKLPARARSEIAERYEQEAAATGNAALAERAHAIKDWGSVERVYREAEDTESGGVLDPQTHPGRYTDYLRARRDVELLQAQEAAMRKAPGKAEARFVDRFGKPINEKRAG